MAEATEIHSDERCIVIGGGLAGVTTAYELAAEGVPVTLLEAGPDLASGASHANGGLLTAGMSDPWNGPGVVRHLAASLFDPRSPMKLRLRAVPGLGAWGVAFLRNSGPKRHRAATIANFRLADFSLARTRALRDGLGLDFDSRDAGCLKIFARAADMAGARAIADALVPHGLEVRQLDTAGVLAVEPSLAPVADSIGCGLFYPGEGSGDARQFTLALADCASSAGAEIRLGSPVVSLLSENDAVVGVETPRGPLRGDVVIAAGIDTPDLLAGVGLSIPVKPVKGYSLTVDATGLGGEGPGVPVSDEQMHAAVSPLGNRLRFVGTAEFTGRDLRIRPERIDNLYALFEKLYPHLVHRIDRSSAVPWAGLRPMSADGVPFVGPARVRGLWINSGHGHLGWTMAAGSARLLADLMLGREAAFDPRPYSPSRANG